MPQLGQLLQLLLSLPFRRLPGPGWALEPHEPLHGDGQPIVQNGPVVPPMGAGPQKVVFVSESQMERFGVDYGGEDDGAFENRGSV